METQQLQRIARNLPDMVKRLMPVPVEDLINYPGLIGFTFEEPMVYLIMAVWAIARASDSVSGEIGRGTMEMLLAQPIGRMTYLLTHSGVTLVGIMLLATAAYAGTHVGIHQTDVKVRKVRSWNVPFFRVPSDGDKDNFELVPMSEFVSPETFKSPAVNYACLGVFLAGITTAASSWDRYRWRTIAIVVTFYIVQTIIEVVGLAVDGCKWMLGLTFFGVYEPVAIATAAPKDSTVNWRFFAEESQGYIPDLGPLGFDVVLLTLGLGSFVLGAWVFNRRDLPAPL
jgi:ABC-2 type transport system permease protein